MFKIATNCLWILHSKCAIFCKSQLLTTEHISQKCFILVSTEENLQTCLIQLEELHLKPLLVPLTPFLLIKQEDVLCNGGASVVRRAFLLYVTASFWILRVKLWLSHSITSFSWSWVWHIKLVWGALKFLEGKQQQQQVQQQHVLYLCCSLQRSLLRGSDICNAIVFIVSCQCEFLSPLHTPSSLAEDKAMMCCLTFMITNS